MSSARVVTMMSGAGDVPLAPDDVLEALFATISYRLEPNGWASRFPTVLDRLHEGRLDVASADAALSELELISAELKKLPADRVVWSMRDLARKDDSRHPVRRDARNAYEYFIARDGRPILACLVDAVRVARASGEPVILASGLRFKNMVRQGPLC